MSEWSDFVTVHSLPGPGIISALKQASVFTCNNYLLYKPITRLCSSLFCLLVPALVLADVFVIPRRKIPARD